MEKNKKIIIVPILCFFRHLVEVSSDEEWDDYSGQKTEGFIPIKKTRSTITYIEQQVVVKSIRSEA